MQIPFIVGPSIERVIVMNIFTAFTRHPAETGETYARHFLFTARASLTLVGSGLILFFHGLMPFLCSHTASNMIDRLHAELQIRKEKCKKSRP